MTRQITAAADRASAALRAAVDDPGTEKNMKAATAIVALRKQFKHEGLPDWAGRSPGYRDMISRIYREAGVPSDSEGNFQANLRYHLGNALRKVAPPDDLLALGMSTSGPLARVSEARAARPPKARQGKVTTVDVGDPVVMACVALASLQAVATMKPGPEVEPVLRSIINEALNILGG